MTLRHTTWNWVRANLAQAQWALAHWARAQGSGPLVAWSGSEDKRI